MTTEHENSTAATASQRIEEANAFLLAILQASQDASLKELHHAAVQFLALIQIAEAAEQDSSILGESDFAELLELIDRCMQAVRDAVADGPGAAENLAQLNAEVASRWGETLDLESQDGVQRDATADSSGGDDAFDVWDDGDACDDFAFDEPANEEVVDEAADVDLDHILSELRQSAATFSDEGGQDSPADSASINSRPTPPTTPQPFVSQNSTASGARILDDPEMAEAYLDDAVRCVASMEQALLAYEADTNNRAALNQVCRELHTLKGASASVELTELAAFLHEVEDSVRSGCDPNSAAPDPSAILESIDKVRAQINAIGGKAAAASDAATTAANPSQPSAPSSHFEQVSSSQEPTLRVKAAQVDRLMDMLAELVMLRNRRDSRVEHLKCVQNELLGCASRVRGLDNALHHHALQRASDPRIGTRSNSFTEVADDIFAASDQLRGVSQPLDAENLAISQFIRQFRQELVDIRRVPAEGLFRRLQRAVRDAAKVEGKEVRLELIGEHTGIDRTLQESLYDPLLHVVRNAVSHGIEQPSDRVSTGKSETGVVTMEARGGANFLVMEVRDDGRGLDYDALRRRGLERNLIKSDQPATEAELAQLIFHPGFSTQNQASEISGRGVGMDVVASAIERLRGWIEIESTTGHGCCIRITVPLESTIEHAMLFRDGKQIFAIPMRFVHTVNTGKDDHNSGNVFGANAIPTMNVSFGGMFQRNRGDADLEEKATLVVGFGADAGDAQPLLGGSVRVAIAVDEIVGPEEVVMRPLPGLLRGQRLFSGVSLAGSGEIVLALDTQQLLDRCIDVQSPNNRPSRAAPPKPVAGDDDDRPRALVVDDSATARRAMVKMLKQRGFAVVDAMDGAEGLATLKASGNFDLLVSDLEMPRIDGLELLQEVRNNPALESLTAILASSRDDDVFQDRARDLDAAAYLIKPVSDERLDEVLKNYSFGKTSC